MAEDNNIEEKKQEQEVPKVRPYRLTLHNERKNRTVFSFRMSMWVVALLLVILTAMTALLAILIVVRTPLRQYLPGYLDVSQRLEVVDLAMRLDSLERENQLRAAYLANMTSVLQDTRTLSQDSIVEYDSTVVRFGDSLLMNASDREKAFREQYERQERFGVNAALGVENPTVTFLTPADGTVLKDSLTQNDKVVRLLLAKEGAVMSPFAGIVVAVDMTLGEGYKVLVQHSDGYVVALSHLTKALCAEGDVVKSGQALGHGGAQPMADDRWIEIRIWNKGVAIEPKNLMRF